jgi:hypothetical protein
MRRIEPAYPDLFTITHMVRPGYLPGPKVALDPIKMGVVWEDAPRRTLPTNGSVPRHPVRAIAFARVLAERREILPRLLERGSAVLLLLDDPSIQPSDLDLDGPPEDGRLAVALPVLPFPLSDGLIKPESWNAFRWGAILGLFPFPGAAAEIERRLQQLQASGASFGITAPLLLTPKDRHRIMDGCDGSGLEERLENSLFHADVARGLHALERTAGVTLHEVGMDPIVPCLVPADANPGAVRTCAQLRMWARRLDQSHEESSWGWRLRRAATALDRLGRDPRELAAEDNLRIVPGFDPWVESFTRSLWEGGEPVESSWQRWSSGD